MVRGKDPVRHHLWRKVHGSIMKPASRTRFLTVPCIHRLRRLMETRMGNAGRREFIQVLRLMEDFHQHQVEQAAAQALQIGAISFDAVKMLLLAR